MEMQHKSVAIIVSSDDTLDVYPGKTFEETLCRMGEDNVQRKMEDNMSIYRKKPFEFS